MSASPSARYSSDGLGDSIVGLESPSLFEVGDGGLDARPEAVIAEVAAASPFILEIHGYLGHCFLPLLS